MEIRQNNPRNYLSGNLANGQDTVIVQNGEHNVLDVTGGGNRNNGINYNATSIAHNRPSIKYDNAHTGSSYTANSGISDRVRDLLNKYRNGDGRDIAPYKPPARPYTPAPASYNPPKPYYPPSNNGNFEQIRQLLIKLIEGLIQSILKNYSAY